MKITAVPELPAPSAGVAGSSPSNQIANVEPTKALTPAVTEMKPAEGDLSSKYAELAKREKINRQKAHTREEALKAREAALAAKEAEYASAYVPKAKIKESFHKDPSQAMRDYELDGDLITQGLLNQPSAEQRMIQELRAEVDALKSVQGQTKSLLDEREQVARTQALNQIRFDIKNLVNSDDAYEVVKTTGDDAIEEILKRYEKKFDDTGELASLEQIAQEVEEEYAQALVKFSQLKKIQARLQPAEVKAEAPRQLAQAPKTLTHSQVSATSRALSPRERAIAMLEGKQI